MRTQRCNKCLGNLNTRPEKCSRVECPSRPCYTVGIKDTSPLYPDGDGVRRELPTDSEDLDS